MDLETEKAAKSQSDARRAMVGTGDRSERIRTYNFPQGRLTDHRIGLTLYQLPEVMEGKIDEIIDGLAGALPDGSPQGSGNGGLNPVAWRRERPHSFQDALRVAREILSASQELVAKGSIETEAEQLVIAAYRMAVSGKLLSRMELSRERRIDFRSMRAISS